VRLRLQGAEDCRGEKEEGGRGEEAEAERAAEGGGEGG